MTEHEHGLDDIFITKINIKKLRHLRDFEISLSATERKHLIITGKNGSGKTSLLEAIRDFIYDKIDAPNKIITAGNAADSIILSYDSENDVSIPQEEDFIVFSGDFNQILFFCFPAHHTLKVDKVKHIEKIRPRGSKDFLKYMLDLDYQKLGAKVDNDTQGERRISQWFANFERYLQKIYKCSELKLIIERKEKEARILMPDREPFNLNQMADGYAALLQIIAELMLFMDMKTNGNYSVSGIVLVDEIETHLHVDMQKEVLPFLTAIFPNIQFIVTTHSPFVISSMENAVICDLEKRIVTQDLSAYSYDGIIEYYYNSDKYSQEIKSRFDAYKMLVNKQERTPEENVQLAELIVYLNNIPSLGAPELVRAFREVELKRKNQNGKN